MDLDRTLSQRFSRRSVLGFVTGTGVMLVLVACGVDDDDDLEAGPGSSDEDDDDDLDDDIEEVDELEDEDDDEEVSDVDADETDDDADETVVAIVDAEAEAEVIVDDVIDFTLAPDSRWDGPFGSVTMRLHHGWVNDEDVTFIRTDASDRDFADREGLVYVPMMANALNEPESHSDLYIFDGGPEGQLPVISSSPADGENFSPAFHIHTVFVVGKTASPITSEREILEAADRDDIRIEPTGIVVNYPVITWPGGQIRVDEDKIEALGGGQLIEEPDVEGSRVTLKLHQCYPGSRYIITDTSALPMAPMMGAGEAGGSQLLIDAGAVAPITIFLNGLEGTGAMGFQPGVFNTNAGDPAWSPFWEHFAAEWVNEDEAVPVTSQRQLDELVNAGDLILYGGVPDTDPDTFVVNCSVPIVAPVTWSPTD